MADPDPNYLFNLADSVLGAVEDYYTTNATGSLRDNALPERRYVSDGLVAWDCAQCTVRVSRTFSVDESGSESGGFPVGPYIRRGAEMVIQILRCVPTLSDSDDDAETGDPPSATDIADSARVILADSQMIDMALIEGYRAGALPGCSGVFIVGWTGDGPEGAFGGGSMTIRMMLD